MLAGGAMHGAVLSAANGRSSTRYQCLLQICEGRSLSASCLRRRNKPFKRKLHKR